MKEDMYMKNNVNYVKIIGIRFDCLEGLQVIDDANVKNHQEAGIYADKHYDENKIFISVPCSLSMKI